MLRFLANLNWFVCGDGAALVVGDRLARPSCL